MAPLRPFRHTPHALRGPIGSSTESPNGKTRMPPPRHLATPLPRFVAPWRNCQLMSLIVLLRPLFTPLLSGLIYRNARRVAHATHPSHGAAAAAGAAALAGATAARDTDGPAGAGPASPTAAEGAQGMGAPAGGAVAGSPSAAARCANWLAAARLACHSGSGNRVAAPSAFGLPGRRWQAQRPPLAPRHPPSLRRRSVGGGAPLQGLRGSVFHRRPAVAHELGDAPFAQARRLETRPEPPLGDLGIRQLRPLGFARLRAIFGRGSRGPRATPAGGRPGPTCSRRPRGSLYLG